MSCENELYCEMCETVVEASVRYVGKALLGSLGAAGTFGVKNPWGKLALFLGSVVVGHLADVAAERVCGRCRSERVQVV